MFDYLPIATAVISAIVAVITAYMAFVQRREYRASIQNIAQTLQHTWRIPQSEAAPDRLASAQHEMTDILESVRVTLSNLSGSPVSVTLKVLVPDDSRYQAKTFARDRESLDRQNDSLGPYSLDDTVRAAVTKGTPIINNHVSSSAEGGDPNDRFKNDVSYKSIIAIPIFSGDPAERVGVGVLTVQSTEENAFNNQALDVVQSIAPFLRALLRHSVEGDSRDVKLA